MKKNSDIEWKELGRPQTAFVVSSGNCWAKSDSPQRDIRFIPTLESEQKTLGRFFNPLLEVSRVTMQRKLCFLEATFLCLRFWLRVEKICWVVKILFLVSWRSTWSKTCFCKKTYFHVFFTLSERLSTEVGTAVYVSRRKFSGFFNWRIILLSSFWEVEQKKCKTFSKTFSACFSELNSTCPEERFLANFFSKSRTFIINSGFWAMTECIFWQQGFPLAYQKCFKRIQRSFRKKRIFQTNLFT